MNAVDNMLAQLPKGKDYPLDDWHPPLCGEIDIVIKRDGSWWHEGRKIEREEIVSLFSNLLRFESDNGFVLVTPVEKWKITVEDAPYIAVALNIIEQQFTFAINNGKAFTLGAKHPLVIQGEAELAAPYIKLSEGVLAKLSRPVYYELAEHASELDGVWGIQTHDGFYPLS